MRLYRDHSRELRRTLLHICAKGVKKLTAVNKTHNIASRSSGFSRDTQRTTLNYVH